jgi:hypothetical protein
VRKWFREFRGADIVLSEYGHFDSHFIVYRDSQSGGHQQLHR